MMSLSMVNSAAFLWLLGRLKMLRPWSCRCNIEFSRHFLSSNVNKPVVSHLVNQAGIEE
jgi:hypothetical protein